MNPSVFARFRVVIRFLQILLMQLLLLDTGCKMGSEVAARQAEATE